jgi:hypothetical protein
MPEAHPEADNRQGVPSMMLTLVFFSNPMFTDIAESPS